MDTSDPIRQVPVVSTGQVQIRPGHLALTAPGRDWSGNPSSPRQHVTMIFLAIHC